MTNSRRTFLRQSAAAAAGITFIPSYLSAGIGGNRANTDLAIGFIGCGRQGLGLARNLANVPGTRLVAACDVHSAKLEHFVGQVMERAAADSGGSAQTAVRSYSDYRALLEHEGLDAVVVATPDHQHATICVAALDRGLHVYCEKPLAHTIEEGRSMVEATQRNNKVLQTGSMQRSMFNFQKAVEVIRAGKLGEVKEVIVSIGGPPRAFDLPAQPLPEGVDWSGWIGPTVDRPYHPDLLPPIDADYWGRWRHYAEFGGGMVTDWGAHMFDIVQWALEKDTTGPTRFYPPLEENAQQGLTLFYADGTRVEHRDFGRGNAVRFVGSEGTLDVARGFIDSTVPDLLSYGDMNHESAVPALVSHLTDFTEAVRSGGTPICPAETGHRTATVCTLSNIAYRLGRPLEWDPGKERIKGDARANRLLGDAYRNSLA
ncbi:Gfo/Idh/MocA family protein [Neolewinella litorea]|uniref:Gfo/Idh/MocA family oxidoreductase n=1 Tax=Neolewinella litorea TaxID=2562452 RepID=A0A4S4NUW0_9BACT|nr:Gfo/Idh/MocA family oxidoreductase [Neolewinella litorea]THH40030.1 Gfo/Idh/MocA family oxidoreductase [Neolewinella litorea]